MSGRGATNGSTDSADSHSSCRFTSARYQPPIVPSHGDLRVAGFNPCAYSFRPSLAGGQAPGVGDYSGSRRAPLGLGGNEKGYGDGDGPCVNPPALSSAPEEDLRAGGITNPRASGASPGSHGNGGRGRGHGRTMRHAPRAAGAHRNNNPDPNPERAYPGGQTPSDPQCSTIVHVLLKPRIFYPCTLNIDSPPGLENLTRYHAPSNTTHTLFRTPPHHHHHHAGETHMDVQTIVISCYAFGARAIGIFFGHNSRHNHREYLMYAPHNLSPLAAQAFAVLKSVKLGRKVANVIGPSRDVVMKIVVATCSEWVVKAVTECLGSWKEEGWNEAMDEEYFHGVRENQPAWERLDRCVEGAVDDGLEVEFWLLRREELAGAQALAQHAVREHTSLSGRALEEEANNEDAGDAENAEDAEDAP